MSPKYLSMIIFPLHIPDAFYFSLLPKEREHSENPMGAIACEFWPKHVVLWMMESRLGSMPTLKYYGESESKVDFDISFREQ